MKEIYDSDLSGRTIWAKEKPRFRISFRYTNYPFIRPGKPYLVPINNEAYDFKWKNYGANHIPFNKICRA